MLRSSRPAIAIISKVWRPSSTAQRPFITLAIETSCDDTSVAVAETPSNGDLSPLKVHFHDKITANNDAYNGIHPLVSLQSHQASLAPLVQRALRSFTGKPDLIAATRGPGMRSNLSIGLDTAKGLALAYDVPFIGVHHMQAHALTSRLVSAMESPSGSDDRPEPQFPFLTVLASGGHTMLVDSTGLTEHIILAETGDIALGDCIDKSARVILPAEHLKTPFGKALEDFAFPDGPDDYVYTAPRRRQEELQRRETDWAWSIPVPFAESKGGQKTSRRMKYSFSGLSTTIERLLQQDSARDISERQTMAREVQRVAFEHLVSRVMLHLSTSSSKYETIVVSGGVASNRYLRHVFRGILDARGYADIELSFPPVALCTDNALMIAWAAIEMWHAGYQSTLDIAPIRKWSMDSQSEDGGILGPPGWLRVTR